MAMFSKGPGPKEPMGGDEKDAPDTDVDMDMGKAATRSAAKDVMSALASKDVDALDAALKAHREASELASAGEDEGEV
jgi:hypothetical protein